MVREKPAKTDILGAAGGLLLALSVFLLDAYKASPGNPNANIDGVRGAVTIWQAHPIVRWLLLLAAIAPVVLLWIIVRQHELSWPRGEMTAVVGLTAATLLLYVGVIDRPGEPSGEISLQIGWFTAFLGALTMAVCGAIRSTETGRRRKPPGVL
jgi:archaellum biogenesis protein FlaJ (TadC family)